MLKFEHLQSFVAVAEHGSFTRASVALGLSKAVVSLHVQQLEAQLNVQLLTRSTRHLSISEVGKRFLQDCIALLSLADDMVESARHGQTALGGTLRVTSTHEYGNRFVIPVLARLHSAHPALEIDFTTSPHPANLVAERIDVAIRLGTLADSSNRAVLLGRFQVVPVATPAFLQRVRLPSSPAELEEMKWIGHKGFDAPLTWSRSGNKRVRHTVRLRAAIQSDTASALQGFVMAHCGCAVLPDWLVHDQIESGELVRLLPEYLLPEQGVFAVFPNTQHLPARVRAFIDAMRSSAIVQPQNSP